MRAIKWSVVYVIDHLIVKNKPIHSESKAHPSFGRGWALQTGECNQSQLLALCFDLELLLLWSSAACFLLFPPPFMWFQGNVSSIFGASSYFIVSSHGKVDSSIFSLVGQNIIPLLSGKGRVLLLSFNTGSSPWLWPSCWWSTFISRDKNILLLLLSVSFLFEFCDWRGKSEEILHGFNLCRILQCRAVDLWSIVKAVICYIFLGWDKSHRSREQRFCGHQFHGSNLTQLYF